MAKDPTNEIKETINKAHRINRLITTGTVLASIVVVSRIARKAYRMGQTDGVAKCMFSMADYDIDLFREVLTWFDHMGEISKK